MIWKLLLISAILIGIAIAAIAIKMFTKKDGEFKKQCGSTDPTTGQRLGCTCGSPEEGHCHNSID
ncbi:MAG: hypothetical protein K9G67_04040 [Bacteroidales bacterium]|nr:hypothetical protein [Bacteroidales bacterium]MCF8345355.1 hypothetical protein [Bacteroidales bacterium]MCF8352029.1 hypothetical protein [Bacteroidales bacterium]MCF8375502.1 hypothetical protein [Bacteroidales bacterium]MCF8399901.1 hypothetical protein [Bacteroidales bacterium]